MDDLENPNVPAQTEALRTVRERKQLEANERKSFRWPTGMDWVLMLGVPIVVLIVSAILGKF